LNALSTLPIRTSRPPHPGVRRLHCLSDFSFGRGASSAQELFDARSATANALAITTRVRWPGRARAGGLARDRRALIVGSEVQLMTA